VEVRDTARRAAEIYIRDAAALRCRAEAELPLALPTTAEKYSLDDLYCFTVVWTSTENIMD
jgi:hypothetical protein